MMLFLKSTNLFHHHHNHLLKPYNYSVLISFLSYYPHTFTTLSNPTTTKHSSSSSSHFMVVDYLISTLGFSPDQAIKASKPLAHLKSPSNPNSVIHFLYQSGWTQSQIRSLIAKQPKLLCCKVDKTLQPKLTAIQMIGLSNSQLIEFICDNPLALWVTDVQPKIKFLQQLLGGNDKLLRANKNDSSLLSSRLDKKLMPNISLLRDCGITDPQIAKFIMQTKGFITKPRASLVALVERAEGLGVPRSCGMFYWMLRAVSTVSVATFDIKFRLLRSLGWSETEIACAIRKMPMLLGYSEKKIRSTMRFLVDEVGCTLSYIAFRPVLLGLSLNKRLIPRHSVLKNLEAEELCKGPLELYCVFKLNDMQFLERYVLPHKEKLPGLYEAYISAAAGKASI